MIDHFFHILRPWWYVSRRFSVSKWRQEKPQAGRQCFLVLFKRGLWFVNIFLKHDGVWLYSYSLGELKGEQSFFYIINKSASKSVAPLSSLKEGSLTNGFHVAVRLFSIRSQMISKCGKNKEVAHEPQVSVSLMFLPHFGVLCDLLLDRPTATWNLFVLYHEQNGKMTNIPRISWLFDDLCQFRCFSNHKRYFSSLLQSCFLLYLSCIQFSETFFNAFTC